MPHPKTEEYLIPQRYFELPGSTDSYPPEIRSTVSREVLAYVLQGRPPVAAALSDPAKTKRLSALSAAERERVLSQVFTPARRRALRRAIATTEADTDAIQAALQPLHFAPLEALFSEDEERKEHVGERDGAGER